MKLIILALTLTFSIFACDSYEAQFIGEVTKVETDSLTYCRAYVTQESISYYNLHNFCPLYKTEAIEQGIDFPLINGHDCEVYVGDTITGVLVKKNGKIILD